MCFSLLYYCLQQIERVSEIQLIVIMYVRTVHNFDNNCIKYHVIIDICTNKNYCSLKNLCTSISLNKMFTVRTHSSKNIEERQKRPFYKIAANGDNIPLEGQNWLQRWCSVPIAEDFFKRLHEFNVKNDDVFVVTFPKCGTTWIQEATWLLVNGLDFETANQVDLVFRSVFME